MSGDEEGMKQHTRSLIRIIRDKIGEPRLGCEVGVWRGDMSRELLLAFPELHMWMVDRWEQYDSPKDGGSLASKSQDEMYDAMQEAVAKTDFASKRRIVMIGDSVSVASLLRDNLLDFLFMDADHRYRGVSRDAPAWYRKVRKGGIFAGHDYNGAGDRSGRFGVKRAVDEFAKRENRIVQTAPQRVWWIQK